MEDNYLKIILICVASYLFGAIPSGYIIAKLIKGIDIRDYGSKNIGATNVARVLGGRYFFLIFTLDAIKGFAPVFISQLIVEVSITKVLAGLFAILGHMFPVYLKFKGGKGVATGAGVIFALNWLVGVVASLIWLITFLPFGYVSLSSILSALALPIAHILLTKSSFNESLPYTIFFALAAIIITIKHSANIKRLVNGTENKVLWVKKLQ